MTVPTREGSGYPTFLILCMALNPCIIFKWEAKRNTVARFWGSDSKQNTSQPARPNVSESLDGNFHMGLSFVENQTREVREVQLRPVVLG